MIFWGELNPDSDSEQTVSVGDLELRLSTTQSHWRVGLFGEPMTANGLHEGWREIPSGPDARLSVLPATPDLPVVLKPDTPIALVPSALVRYQVLVPLWLRLMIRTGTRTDASADTLGDVPSRVIKRTWFGTGENGEVAYGIRFSPDAYSSARKDHFSVPLIIKNTSHNTLWFERFLLPVIHLDLYHAEAGIMSNTITVLYKGADQFSQIYYGDGSSLRARGYEKIAPQRLPVSKDIFKKSFLWLGDLTA